MTRPVILLSVCVGHFQQKRAGSRDKLSKTAHTDTLTHLVQNRGVSGSARARDAAPDENARVLGVAIMPAADARRHVCVEQGDYFEG